MFAGKSSLRATEVVPVKVDPALQAYLQRYGNSESSRPGSISGDPSKKKRKKRKAGASALAGVRILDESVSGFIPDHKVDDDEPEEEDAEGYGVPVVANAEEAERAARQVEAAKLGFFGTRDDGSGWQANRASSPNTHGSSGASQRQDSDSDSDAEPVRRKQRHDSDSDVESMRGKQRHDSDSDFEPARRKARDDSDSDAVVPRRKQRHDSDEEDASPPRRGQQDSDADMSPPRRRGGDEDDLSPPRKRTAPLENPSDAPAAAAPGSKKPRMTDGTATGIITAGALKSEMDRKREFERQRFDKLDAATTGRGAETVFRNKEGQTMSKAELEAVRKAELEAKEKERETPEWASGLKQQREAAERRAAMAADASKPFARSKDDTDLDAMYRAQSRFGDPMAAYVKQRQPTELPAISLPGDGKRKKGGFVVPQGVPQHSWLKRNLGQPINRYRIRPGRHWDGVDRSTGFEKKYFRTVNERKYMSQQASAWGQEDM